MKTHAHRWIVVAAIISVGAGAAFSHIIAPGVRVEKIMLTRNTPALRIFPATPGPHPIALLAHGSTGSKETMFRFGEALAAAGFDCYSVDQAGHGESPQPCTLTNLLIKPKELERALGAVAVYIGHSMGGGVGAWSVRKDGFQPKLFIGVGAPVELGEHGPPMLLLAGLFEELHRPARFQAQTNAQVVISPWSDHILETFDPVLVRAAVKAACDTVGKPVPAAPTAWRWRFAGLVLGITGALGLMLYLPELHPRLARIRRFIVPAVLLIALILTLGTWLGVTPQLRRIPSSLFTWSSSGWRSPASAGCGCPNGACLRLRGYWRLVAWHFGLPIRRTVLFHPCSCASSRSARCCCCRDWPSAESSLVAGRGVMETLPWPSLRAIASGNSCHCSIEE